MQHANPVRQNDAISTMAALAAKAKLQSAGLTEIAVLSLAGLTLSVMMIAARVFPDALSLVLAQ